MYFQQTVEQKIADLNKIESLTKAKVDNDVEQALRNVRKAVARAPEPFDPHQVWCHKVVWWPQGRTVPRVVPQRP